jgi:hypothetical protein
MNNERKKRIARIEASAKNPRQMSDIEGTEATSFRENEAREQQEFLDRERYRYGPLNLADSLMDCMPDGEPTSRTGDASQRVFTPLEVGLRWRLDTPVIRQMLASEPNVIWVRRRKSSRKRTFLSMLIPASVVISVGERLGLAYEDWKFALVAGTP